MRQCIDSRYARLTYDGFRELAQRRDLSKYERIGFPDAFRQDFEEVIFGDIRAKLPRLDERERTIIDIGPGCSELPMMLIRHCRDRSHRLLLVDSPEMLAQLPDGPELIKIPGMFPTNVADLRARVASTDVIVCYSVLQYAFVDTSVWNFLDEALLLLAPGGQMLLGDIPNASKRKRFLASAAGRAFHREYTASDTDPFVAWNTVEPGAIDDAVVMALLSRARAAGVDAYVMPQPEGLPMANRREDILLRKP